MEEKKERALDLHCTMMMDEYREIKPALERLEKWAYKRIKDAIDKAGLMVTACEELDLYEIRHSDKVVPAQTRHLAHDEVVEALVDSYGALSVGRHVLYRGPSLPDPLGLGIDYVNVEEYLAGL